MPSSRKALASCLHKIMKHPDSTPGQMLKASICLGKLHGYFIDVPDEPGRPDKALDPNRFKHLEE